MIDIVGKKITRLDDNSEGYVAAYDPTLGITIKSFASGVEESGVEEHAWQYCINLITTPEDSELLIMVVDAIMTNTTVDLLAYDIIRDKKHGK